MTQLTARPAIDEHVRHRFERAWLRGRPEAIDDCLPAESDPRRAPTLEELVCIDLEFMWKAWGGQQGLISAVLPGIDRVLASPPRVEDYVQKYPALSARDALNRLIRQEIVVRREIGDKLSATEFTSRFPELQMDWTRELAPPGSDGVGGQSLQIGAVIGPFVIESRLGAGGMGIVYQARHQQTGQPVALKILGPSLCDRVGMARFGREVQAVARLNHPGVARLVYAGQDEQTCFMAMELVNGISLRVLLRRLIAWNRPGWTINEAVLAPPPSLAAPSVRFDAATVLFAGNVDTTPDERPGVSPDAQAGIGKLGYLQQCCVMIRDVARALQHAHSCGVVHRDLKPENLMIEGDGRMRVIDFGLARYFEDETLTVTGQLVGTPLYMSPEQVAGRGTIDHRTDIYSLGMVLFELLTLRSPLVASNREELLRKIAMKALPPVNWLNAAVPPALTGIVHMATAKEQDRRYSSAGAMAADLERFLNSDAVLAPPYDFPFDDWEITSRRPDGVVGVAFVFYLALIPSVIGIVGASIGAFADRRPWWPGVGLLLAFLGGTVLFPLVANGLLAGRPWTRRTAQVFLGLFLSSPVIAIGADFAFGNRAPREGGLPVLVGTISLPFLIGAIVGLATLAQRNVVEWFTLAKRLRDDYRAQRVSVAQQARPI